MTLKEKLKNIKNTSTLSSLNEYPDIKTAKDLDALWINVIEPNLPNKPTIEKWHNILMEYIKQYDAAFSLRAYASPSGNSHILRRGFLNKVFVAGNEDFETFYVDNGFTAYFYSMAKDGYVPKDCDELKSVIKNREFPCSFIQTNSEKQLTAYLRGTNPEISKKGYKIAHIFSAGENYNYEANFQSIGEFCERIFPRGERSDWSNITSAGHHYRRIDFYNTDEVNAIKAFAIAHFLRTVHPINYFLVPNKPNRYDEVTNILKTNIYWYEKGIEFDEIGEYPALIEYVAAKIKTRYGKIYDEFLSLIYPTGNCINPKEVNVNIDAEYAIGVWQKKIGGATISSKTSDSITKNATDLYNKSKKAPLTGGSTLSVNAGEDFSEFEVYASRNGVSTPSGYTSKIKAVMKELSIESISELNERIDEAIDYCDKKVKESRIGGDEKTAKKYSDYRAILKKYKNYLEEFAQSVTRKDEVADILYIHYKKGWSSFRPVDEHVVEYIIENGEITISYNIGFGPGKTITKKITDKDMRELVCIMDEAVAKRTLVKSNTVIRTVHGTVCGYDYDYRGYSERDCCSLFTDDSLNARYSRLIDKIIK